MLDPPTLSYIAFCLFTGGFIKGIVGLGLPLISVPLLSFALPLKTSVALMTGPILLTNLVQIFEGGRAGEGLQPLLADCRDPGDHAGAVRAGAGPVPRKCPLHGAGRGAAGDGGPHVFPPELSRERTSGARHRSPHRHHRRHAGRHDRHVRSADHGLPRGPSPRQGFLRDDGVDALFLRRPRWRSACSASRSRHGRSSASPPSP